MELARIGVFVVLLIAAPALSGEDVDAEMTNAGKVIGPEGGEDSCSNCHTQELDSWKQTRHYATYAVRHQTDEATAIMANMGIRSMRRTGECRGCHYTSQVSRDRIQPRWGISCESCHGPAKDWNLTHNMQGDRQMKIGDGRNETPQQRAARLDAAQEQGMIHSDMIYEIALNCLGCHTVPDEKLVNVGKHKSGSDFDLVAWSQGEIRHNYLTATYAAGVDGGSGPQRESPVVTQRRMYVIGAMVDLEVSLRNLAGSQEPDGVYRKAMVERVNAARRKIGAILETVKIEELSSALATLPETVDETTSIGATLADGLAKATRDFTKRELDLAAVDPLLPNEFKGQALK